MKKISILFAFVSILSLQNQSILTSYDNTNSIYNEDESNEDQFNFEDDLNGLSLDSNNIQRTHRNPGSNADAIKGFFSLVNNPSVLLNTPIYQQTSPIRNRSILVYPFTLSYGFNNKEDNQVSLFPFINYASKKNYTESSTTLDSYFLLGNPEKIAELEYIDNLLNLHTAADLAQSLSLFDPATVEERRLGGVLESHIIHNKVNLSIQLPILYVERNLYLTPQQKAAISMSSLGNMLETDGVDENNFIYDHIVMDQVGLGDFKFKATYQMHATERFNLNLGGFVILPTATPFAQGIVGTWFKQNNDRAYLDLATINPLAITDQNKDDIANFFLASIDKLSSNILNCPLGNNGHVVIAPSIDFDWFFTQNWQFSNDFSLQIPLPSTEQRFYQRTQTSSEFNLAYNQAYNDPDSLVFVQFVNQELQDLFFPYVFPTMVYPGMTYNSTNQFVYHLKTTDLYLGSNFWLQQAESLSVQNLSMINQSFSYDYKGAQAAYAAQEKIFGKVQYTVDTGNYSWSFSGYGDITIWNSGIGNDFTLGICIDCNF